uniref:Uncharacterized protein n=1 Tax=viral metagenome TaxID=1070528 RepID=A0A6M3X696_9ZZZZ
MGTCRNFDCKNYKACTVNIWTVSYKTRPCKSFGAFYQSQKERIRYEFYLKNLGKSFGNYWED